MFSNVNDVSKQRDIVYPCDTLNTKMPFFTPVKSTAMLADKSERLRLKTNVTLYIFKDGYVALQSTRQHNNATHSILVYEA